MPLKKSKISTDRAEPSAAAAAAAAAEAAARSDAAMGTKPPAPQRQLDSSTTTRAREKTPEGDVKEIELDQNGNEIEEDEEGEITK